MRGLKELSAETIWKALEGQKDILTPEVEKEMAFFRQSSCPQCQGSQLAPFVDPKRPFSPGTPLPKKLLRCLACKCEFNPTTGLVLKAGLPSDQIDPLTGG
jgi:hypothetical protein